MSSGLKEPFLSDFLWWVFSQFARKSLIKSCRSPHCLSLSVAQMPELSPTILIADDEPNILRVMARFLRAGGYTVVTAQDGEAALEAFEQAQHTIQLVISDVMMPRMRGPQLVRSIKGLSPSMATLLMSGTWSSVNEEGVALMRKPFTRQKLVAIVQDLLAACDFVKIEREQSLARSLRRTAMSGTEPQPRGPVATK